MREHEHRETRFGAQAQAAEWDARYSERDGAMWSGRPNGRLLAEVAGLTPGRALDVGCGEGADARPREDWAEIAVPAIVSEDAFARAGQRLEDNKRFAIGGAKVPSLLQGLAARAACGCHPYRQQPADLYPGGGNIPQPG